MTRGVVYLNKGTKCLVRALVSIFSLRKVYNGPVRLVAAGLQPDWFANALRELDAELVEWHDPPHAAPLVLKSMLWRGPVFDETMFIDADTVILKPIDEYFSRIAEFDFCVGHFAGWQTTGKTIAKRIKAMRAVATQAEIDNALKYGPAVNTGVFGFRKGVATILPAWADMTRRAHAADSSFIPDELACQVLLPAHKHWCAPVEWGTSVKYGQLTPNTIIVHYHGRKHVHPYPMCAIWKRFYWELVRGAAPELRAELAANYGDKRFNAYLRGRPTTFVTGADKRYLPLLKNSWPELSKLAGAANEPWLCYIDGYAMNDPELDFLDARVERMPWSIMAASQRERMLSAFVLGAARHVATPWFVKVDADTVVSERGTLELPEVLYNYALAGHKWHYTKPGRFLRTLEDWGDTVPELRDKPRLFTEAELAAADAVGRYGHKRIASFICLHKTEFVRRCAAMAGRKLPVPSHDTYLWYCAARLGEPWARFNVKRELGLSA